MKIITHSQAKHQALERYFTGKPCKYNHISERRTKDGKCVECYIQNSKHYCKKYRETHSTSEHCKQYNKQYSKQYNKVNRVRLTEKRRQYRESNRAQFNTRDARRRAQKLQASPTWANRVRINEIYLYGQQISQITNTKYQIDHIVPLINDLVCGLHNEFNLQILRKSENQSKSNAFDPVTFIHKLPTMH